jgi:hypothetical protein
VATYILSIGNDSKLLAAKKSRRDEDGRQALPKKPGARINEKKIDQTQGSCPCKADPQPLCEKIMRPTHDFFAKSRFF